MKYVDLGLSVLWADCNIGANTPEEFGNYYKWDEIPKMYKIPTLEQYKELINNCNWKWAIQNGVSGYKLTSHKNGNSIFLPAAGHRYYNDACGKDNYGFYWSSSPNTNYKDSAYYLYFDLSQVDYGSNCYHMGFSVRTIKSKTNFKNKTTMTLAEVDKIFPLKSGMCVELFSGASIKKLILFQYGSGEICYIDYINPCAWDSFKSINKYNNYDTIKIYQSPTIGTMFSGVDLIFNSDNYKVKELTMQEIADKFGIKVEQLRIKE